MEKTKLVEGVLDTTDEEVISPQVNLEDTHPLPPTLKSHRRKILKGTCPWFRSGIADEKTGVGKTPHSGTGVCRFVGVSCIIVLVFLVSIAGFFTIGLFVGRNMEKGKNRGQTTPTVPVPSPTPSPSVLTRNNWGDKVKVDGKEVDVLSWLDENMNADNMKNNLANLTLKPHIAGSKQNQLLAEMIYKQWTDEYKLDKVTLFNYSVCLSYPNTSNPNTLELKNSSGDTLYESHIAEEPPLIPAENDSSVAPPFNAYSGSGSVSGPLVYLNYGRLEDFLYLTANLSLNLTDYICIVRYGANYRGDKAHLAQHYGCKGLLIYSDPMDYAPEGVPLFPDGPSLPEYSTQRGSLLIREGDPLTPGKPAIEGMHRRPYSEAQDEESIPKIPVQPVSYGDAEHFLSQLEDHDAPSDWVGGLNITYKILQSSNNTNYVALTVNNYLVRKTIYNVVATLYGTVEPDRFIILGNHRDAWVFGGVDPNSGTAVLMEVARVFSELKKNNWHPGRTVVLCSWDAEEYGLIGSTEWVEDLGKLLGSGTMAYLNVDFSLSGSDYLLTQANPLLYAPIWDVAQNVKCPDPGFDTVYDQWLNITSKDYNGTVKPTMADLGSGSDYTAFLQILGITSSSHNYKNRTSSSHAAYHSVYHSVHDNFYWVSHFADPQFTHHKAVGLLWTKLALTLSNTPVLPFDPRYYAISVHEIFEKLKKNYGDTLLMQGIRLDYLRGAVSDFSDACVSMWDEIQHVLQHHEDISQDENTVRILNNKLMNLERAFIHPEGLPGRSYFKHVIYAPSSMNTQYGSSLFPGIQDTILAATLPGMEGSWDDVAEQVDIVRNHLRYATQILNEPSLKFIASAGNNIYI